MDDDRILDDTQFRQGQIAALKHAAFMCESAQKRERFYAGYMEACEDLRKQIEASLQRVSNGEPMIAPNSVLAAQPICKSCRPFRGRPWTRDEMLNLVWGYVQGHKMARIGEILFRPLSEIREKTAEIDAAIKRLNSLPLSSPAPRASADDVLAASKHVSGKNKEAGSPSPQDGGST